MTLKKHILMSKTFLLIPLILLSTSFYRVPSYCKMARRITKNYLNDFATPRRLILIGYGGAMMDDIQEIFLDLLSFDALNVDQARRLYVEMMEEFLQRINSHEKIRPYLHNFPFGVDNIKLTLGFDESVGKIRSDGHVAHMFIGRNHTLYYAAYDPTAALGNQFYDLHKETYEEARKIVTGQYTRI